jgi:hypothetical protein
MGAACRVLGQVERATYCLGDNCQSSGLYGPVGSSQVRLGGDSVEPGLVRCSCGLWMTDRMTTGASDEARVRGVWASPQGPVLDPDHEAALRQVRLGAQLRPGLATTSGWRPTVSQPWVCSDCATLIADTDCGRLAEGWGGGASTVAERMFEDRSWTQTRGGPGRPHPCR